MVRAEEEDETMRPCGCHAGRPCTCEMGKQAVATTFVCGVCVNCRLNAREGTRARRRSLGPRRCLKSAEYMAELEFDRIVLRENVVFRMRKPDWAVDKKTSVYNKLHQMRLAMIQTRAVSLATIDIQKKRRTKYSHDLRKAQEAIKKLESVKTEAATNMRKMTKEQLCVDSDVFDSFSKQLIAAETIVPDLQSRLEKANVTISTEQSNIKIIREYVRDVAVRKLQTSVRAFFRLRRWKSVLSAFHEDVRLSAALEIQATWRMFAAKMEKHFRAQLLHDKAKTNAANVLRRFSLKVIEAKRRKKMTSDQEVEAVIAAHKQKSFDVLFQIFGRCVLYDALVMWKQGMHEARTRTLKKTLASAILIQRVYRGFRDRVYLKRIKIRSSLTDRVRSLVDQFIVSGDFWGFILEMDADYRRFMHKIEEEEADATNFMSTVLRQRKLDEDQMMQDWFTASALQNPLVSGIDQVSKTYSSEEGGFSSESSASQAILQSALIEDLVALSPNKTKEDMLPADFPPKVIRQAMANGFALEEVIAVMRGLQAQRKNIEDTDLVLSTLRKRSPLMTNPWTSERVFRGSRGPNKFSIRPIPVVKLHRSISSNKSAATDAFVSENMLDSIPGGMAAPVARLLLVAALRCYDPGSRGDMGRFVPCERSNLDLFPAYLRAKSPLVKIRSEQQAMEAVKPFLHTLLENRCYTAYDILYNVRGVGELVSWNIPSPLAKSIYSVIQEIHKQSTHVSKRNIVREVRVSADFEQFVQARTHKQELVLTSSDVRLVEKPTGNLEPPAANTWIQVKARLESEVLGLPLRDTSIPASELLFMAAFLADENITDPTTESYQTFLQSLLTLQAAGNTETMKKVIATRVHQAKLIADGHAQILQLFGVANAGNLMRDNLIQVLIKDQALRKKVAELLDPFTTSNRKACLQPDYHTMMPSVKPSSLSPLIKHGQNVIDSMDEAATRSRFNCKAPVSSQEQLLRS